jgi:hypothetical protein
MKQLIEGEDYYVDASGLYVFTEKYHLKRGFCCGKACRHCPYEYLNVPEPLRTKALHAKKQNNQ